MFEYVINGVNIRSDVALKMDYLKQLLTIETEKMKKERNQKIISIEIIKKNDEEAEVVSKPIPNIKRLRRITGYLSEIENFNLAKRSEERDRIKHFC